MKLTLPMVSRYAFLLLALVVLADLIVVAGSAFVLYRAVKVTNSFTESGYRCISYAPTVSGTLYIVVRCKREAEPK